MTPAAAASNVSSRPRRYSSESGQVSVGAVDLLDGRAHDSREVEQAHAGGGSVTETTSLPSSARYSIDTDITRVP